MKRSIQNRAALDHTIAPAFILPLARRAAGSIALPAIALLLYACTTPAAATLKLGQLVEKNLQGGESHSYRISLGNGEHLQAVAEQDGIDLAVSLSELGGKEVMRVDTPNSVQGRETIWFTSPAGRDYSLRVQSLETRDPPGRYRIWLEAVRMPDSQDLIRSAAAQAHARGERLTRESRFEEALQQYGEALEGWQSVQNDLQAAITWYAIGNAQFYSGRFRLACSAWEQGRQLSEAQPDPGLENSLLRRLGECYEQLSLDSKALAAYQEALEVSSTLTYRQIEARALHFLSIFHQKRGQFERALHYSLRALEIWRQIGHGDGVADINNTIGSIYLALGQLDQASDHWGDALDYWNQVDAPNLRAKAEVLYRSSGAYFQMGDSRRAIQAAKDALQIERSPLSLQALGDGWWKNGVQLQEKKLLRQAVKSFQQAQQAYQEALERAKGSDIRQEANLWSLMSRLYDSLGDADKALASAQKALDIYSSSGFNAPLAQASARYRKARALKLKGDLKGALESVKGALQTFEALRSQADGLDYRRNFSALRHDYYEFYIHLLMTLHKASPQAGYDRIAFHAFETVQARSLIESLGEAQAGIRQSADGQLLEREASIQQSLNSKRRELDRLASLSPGEARIPALEAQIRDISAASQQVEAEIRRSSPRYADLTRPRILTLTEVQEEILDDGTLLLAYSLGDEQSYLWLVSPKRVRTFPLLPRKPIEGLVRRYQRLAGKLPDSLTQKRLQAVQRQLSQILIEPVWEWLEGKRIVLVASDALQYVSFAALPLPPPADPEKPLATSCQVVSQPSASTLAVLRAEAARRQPPPSTLAILADPVFNYDDPRLQPNQGGLSSDPSKPYANLIDPAQFKRLPYSEAEALAILALVPDPKRVALGFEASLKTLRSMDLRKYRILHFATHARIYTDFPYLSGLVLSQVDRNLVQQEGLLRLHEIYGLELSANLVVLSACETALGREVRGEGIMGLTRGFMYAGAARVLVSLWKVNDEATSELMTFFYQGMFNSDLSPAAALRHAQLQMLQHDKWKDPHYWAGFVLQGEWR